MILNIKKIKKHKNLNHTIEHFENYKEFDRNAFIESQSNNNKFSLLTESLKSFDRFKMNIKLTMKNQTVTSELMPPFIYVDKDRHHENIENKLDKLFNLIYQRIKIELKNEAGLYKNKQIFLYEIDKLENDMSIIKDNLSNYITENTILKNPKKIRKDIEYLISQHYDLLIKTKISLRLINLELNNTLQLSSSSHAMNATYNGLDKINSNIYMLAVEKKLLKNEIRWSISNIHMQVPPKSTASPINEEAYIKSIQNRMHTVLRLIELKEQLVETYKLQKLTELPEYINNLYSVEKQISNVKTDISLFINEHSENKGTNSIFSDITPLLTEISNKKTKIISIEKMIGEKLAKTNADFINIDENDKDLASLLSSIMAEFQQDTMANEINYQPSHNNPATIFTMLRE
ncbi:MULTISPECIES: hypothetical protein [Providencia]|uniref:hypothetical protein n=1 Tax=Providencia TaxID=586 RepID=UPI0023495695|nr:MULTISPECIES: hypothetical protein [Providencia]MDH2364734.1 hypothetical protein [Providencia rettgeri]